jgi:predicted secreted protein
MGRFFDLFPRTAYTLSNKKYSEYQQITNILFRTAFVRDLVYNTSAYIQYTIKESDTPEILASKVYKDPTAYWIILYANDIIDPQFDWPLTTTNFNNYMVDKYRAMAEDDENQTLQDYQVIAWTQDLTNANSVHHYEKVVKQENLSAGTTTEFRYRIDGDRLTDNVPSVPYDNYEDLTATQSVVPINLTNGETVIQTTYRNSVTYYDYELEKNEAKRNIRIIKSEYYPQIVKEFEALSGVPLPSFFRRVN